MIICEGEGFDYLVVCTEKRERKTGRDFAKVERVNKHANKEANSSSRGHACLVLYIPHHLEPRATILDLE